MLEEYIGAIHIHTNCSDGAGNFEEIIKAGAEGNLDFMVITDHDTLCLKEKEGWYDKVMVLVGEEISPDNAHYLALNIYKEIDFQKFTNPQEYIEEVNRQGGFGFVTHPFHKGKKLPFIPPHPWEDFYLYKGFQGIEIWSLMYDWVKKVNLFNLPFHFFFPITGLRGPSGKMLKIWDTLSQKRKVVGIAGLDIHGNKILPFSISSYTFAFRTLRTHIWCQKLCGKFLEDRKKVYQALKEGHSFMALDKIEDSKGFRLFTEKENIPGDRIELTSSQKLYFTSPVVAFFRFIRNGKVVKEVRDSQGEIKLKKSGVYRLEGYLRGKPWIFTNPIWVSCGLRN